MNQENLTIPRLFKEAVAKFPQKTALQFKKGNLWVGLTYRDLEVQALRIANFLLKEGLHKGDCVGLFLENRPEWVEIYLGIMYAGLTCVPLDQQLNTEEIKNLILDSKARVLFCSDELFIKKINTDIGRFLTKIVVVDLKESKSPATNCIDFCQIQKTAPQEESLPSLASEDVASLIYTSGTTGQPKGVLLTHKNICSNFISISKINLCFASDNFISFLPLHHTYPFMVTLVVPLLSGATVTFCPLGFNVKNLVTIIKEAGVSILVGIPQLFSFLHNAISERIKKIPPIFRFVFLPLIRAKIRHDFGRKLRLLASGGARLESEIGWDLKSWGFNILEGYGLTETSPVVTFSPPEKVKFGSVGKPLPDVQIKILNPDKSGTGEILIKGPNVMQGYFKQPELTSSVIKEDWFYSGDLGYIDKDGYLFISGRGKEVIVLSSGKNIYPEEMEAYYNQSPYIKEICVLGRQEERFGHVVESLYAVIVPELDYFRSRGEANIRAKIRWELENLGKNLPNYKHIMGFALAKEELPRTALRKIQRYKVKEKYIEAGPAGKSDIQEAVSSPQDMEILNQDIPKKIMRYLASQIKQPVYLDSHLEIDLGIDSLSRVELGLGLEALLSIKIPDEVLYTVSTVKEIILRISELLNKASPESRISATGEVPKTWTQILKELPEEDIIKKVRLQVNILDYLVIGVFKNLFLFIFRVFWMLRVKKKNNLPKDVPYIICPNHASYLDGFVVFCSLPLKVAVKTYFLGYNVIFEHPLVRWAIRWARLIPIDPDTHLIPTLQVVSYVLSHKKVVCIFPEGRRSIDESIAEFKKGVGILMKELNVPVVPAYIKGSHQSWPRGSRLPRLHPLKIIFGRPCSGGDLLKAKKEEILDDYEAIVRGLKEEVSRLAC
ncbi:MAG: AMP-binding protein [Candidatus Omnitrophica bacterium]|nr:AMP-binding protein [Candidatus Omnitrophota bacterium]